MNSEFWTAIGSAATAIAVGITAIQIALARRQERTQFEDGFVKEYRDLLATLPRAVLLQEKSADEHDAVLAHMPYFYRYFDLCNEQIFLRQKGRIRTDTWEEWRAGIASNLGRPGFRTAWLEVQRQTNSFAELRCLDSNPGIDPRSRRWKRAHAIIEAELKVNRLRD